MLPQTSAFGIAVFGGILLLSVIVSRIAEKIKLPSVILFILLGIAMGPYGIKINGKPLITPENIPISIQSIVGVSLAFLLFQAGFLIRWESFKGILLRTTKLVTIGLGITVSLLGITIYFLTSMDPIYAILLAAILGSTDPFAVFSFSSKLKPHVARTLEAETICDDSVVILIVSAILSSLMLAKSPLPEMSLSILAGILVGILSAFLCALLVQKFKIERKSPIFLIGFTIFVYAITELIGGNGILSCFIFGLILGNVKLPYTRNIKIIQKQITAIVMVIIFTLTGILINLEQLTHSDLINGLIITFALLFLIRPFAVYASLIKEKLTIDEKTRIGLIGPRGIVSAALASEVSSLGLYYGSEIVNLTFVVIVASILIDSLIFLAIGRKSRRKYRKS